MEATVPVPRQGQGQEEGQPSGVLQRLLHTKRTWIHNVNLILVLLVATTTISLLVVGATMSMSGRSDRGGITQQSESGMQGTDPTMDDTREEFTNVPSPYVTMMTPTPTDQPSSEPSEMPTLVPTLRYRYPSLTPTDTPTVLPTSLPTSLPTTSSPTTQEFCYRNSPDDQQLTSGQWWQTSSRHEIRHKWVQKRLPYEPIVNSNTLIVGVLYSFSGNIIKLSAYFPPLHPQESRVATLILKGQSTETRRQTNCIITPNIWHCAFRIDNVARTQSYSYKVRYRPIVNDNNTRITYTYNGYIPMPVGYPRIATLGCFGLDSKKDKIKLVQAIQSTSPNLLILSGDQTYQHEELVYGFLETLYTIQEITRNIPTIVQMDDHDYGQKNLFGAGAGDNNGELSGSGFEKLPCMINYIEELMLSHNPDPVRPSTLLSNGIRVWYTNYIYDKVDFALTEVRKFKQNSLHLDDAITNQNKYSMLGQEQEEWLSEWCGHDDGTSRIKVVLVATPFASLATHMTSYKPHKFIKSVTLHNRDSNGYPVAGRTRVMNILKGCSPLVISGDQHLGIVVTYDEYGVTDCVAPAVLNSVFWRFNYGMPGASYVDIWGHQYTLHNAWNVDDDIKAQYALPRDTRNETHDVKNARADGFMTVDLDGIVATCTMHEYWLGHGVRWNVTVPAAVS